MLNEPFKVVWGIIPIILILGLIGVNSNLDLQLHDTYFVIAAVHIGILFVIILGIIGWIYWRTSAKKLVPWMTLTHTIATVVSFVLIMLAASFFKELVSTNVAMFRAINQLIFLMLLIALLSQVVFIINLIISTRQDKE